MIHNIKEDTRLNAILDQTISFIFSLKFLHLRSYQIVSNILIRLSWLVRLFGILRAGLKKYLVNYYRCSRMGI